MQERKWVQGKSAPLRCVLKTLWYYAMNDLASWVVHCPAQLLLRHRRQPHQKEDQSWSRTFQGLLLFRVSLCTRVIVLLQVIIIRSCLEIATLLAAVLYVRICQPVLHPHVHALSNIVISRMTGAFSGFRSRLLACNSTILAVSWKEQFGILVCSLLEMSLLAKIRKPLKRLSKVMAISIDLGIF